MNERELRRRIAEVRDGRRSRRAFLREMAALGLSAPFAAQMLAHSGVAMAAAPSSYAPTKAGGGGTLKLL
ncbi:MAG TPA: peptide ABC transporter substrate-binding protein, partial [Stellaceae bacterium]|nr:peptide ABC transporter substrate-binding protein [Stellaceae bacterium]